MTERAIQPHFASGLSHSFSMASLAEGSEPISEAEEINEMKSLRERGDQAMEIRDFQDAVRFYNEALEIDEKSVDVLKARTLAFLEMRNFLEAKKDAETLMSVEPDNPQAYKFLGIACQKMGQHRDAMKAFLTSLDLDPDNADDLTDHIAYVSANFCDMTEEMLDRIADMDPYKKLSEVGVCLFQVQRHDMCIKILEAAQRFQTNQKGITMRVLLTMANAHSALRHTEQAINLYQECLSTAMATHEQIYQTKALVNIASLYLEMGDTQQAIVFYEKLLDLEAELKEEFGSEENFPEFWTKELQCGLHLNLSIAYKTIGNMIYAEKNARHYVQLLEKFGMKGREKSESYHNTGMLNEILGNFNEALTSYLLYLKNCKKNGNKKGIAQAYGCLGSVYAALRNWKLSVTYHEQHISMATKLDDSKMNVIANEMLADTYMVMEEHERAVTYYTAMLNACIRTDYRAKSMAYCKMGNAYREMKRWQYCVYYYEQACNNAEDFGYKDILTMCQFNIACIQQNSSQLMDIEKARKYFEKLIPFYEGKIKEHRDEDTYCPSDYHRQLAECYDGIQTVLSKLGNKEECLEFAEAYRKRGITQMLGYPVSFALHGPHSDMWKTERIFHTVDEQNATVLYYSVLSTRILLWIIVPGKGLARFYSGKSAEDTPMNEQLEKLIEDLKMQADWKTLQNSCEDRCLQLRDADLEYTRRRNLRLSRATKKNENNNGSTIDDNNTKAATRKLFTLLLAPIEDILLSLEKQSNLIIVPDKSLCNCPFSLLQDWNGRYLSERFHVTHMPSLFALERVVNNELNQMKALDELEFDRSQSQKGALSKVLAQMVLTNATTPDSETPTSSESVNLRKVSNPRFTTILQGISGLPDNVMRNRGLISSNENVLSEELHGLQTPQSPRQGINSSSKRVPELVSHNTAAKYKSLIGCPSPLEKLLSAHTYTTLTSRTSTGTDITSSTQCITPFLQISSKDKSLVFGNPKLPEKLLLHGKEWKPASSELSAAKRELSAVASYLGTDDITGAEATREYFMKHVPLSTIIHIATYGCWKEALIVTTPSPARQETGATLESSYCISADDILGMKLKAQLVVLSLGFGPNRVKDNMPQGYPLASAFLAAGAQCVLVCTSPLPNIAMEKFYFHFYTSLQSNSKLTDAVRVGIKNLKTDDRFNSMYYLTPWLLIGKDVNVNLCNVRHSMLDQSLDQAEQFVEEESGKELLNPKTVLPVVPTREEQLKSLQELLGLILQYHTRQPKVVPHLIDLLDSALKRLHTEENNRQTSTLSDSITNSTGGLDLLRLLSFHFQARGAQLAQPYVVYPHWNKDDLLIPTFDALRAVIEISHHVTCTQALYDMVPISQDSISHLVDLLCITKHAPEIQLKVTDLSVKPLWQNLKIKRVLTEAGFHQIGLLLNYKKTPKQKVLLTALLQFFLSCSAHKNQLLLYRLDVTLLGKPSVSKLSMYSEYGKLPSLTPIILPRNQLRMSTPWLSRAEKPDEMDEKVKLARSKSDLDSKHKDNITRAKTWHQITVVAQANEALAKYGRPKSTPSKVKVKPGGTASKERIPVKKEPLLVIPEVDQRRDYANFVLHQRMENIDVRHKNEIMKLYLPYVQGTTG